ncbi:MAG: NUDIX domain-containing protein [Patescibacteria group bacterium]
MNSIVVKAMCIFRRGDGKLLFSRGYDEVKKEAFLRPLGGHVEFCEKGEDAIRRELREEVGSEIRNLKLLQVLENIFTYHGKSAHEIIFMYEGELENPPTKDRFTFTDGGKTIEAGWFSKADVEKEGIPIFPPFNYF